MIALSRKVLILAVALCSTTVFAQIRGTDVIYINGVDNTIQDVKGSVNALSRVIAPLNINANVRDSYNPTGTYAGAIEGYDCTQAAPTNSNFIKKVIYDATTFCRKQDFKEVAASKINEEDYYNQIQQFIVDESTGFDFGKLDRNKAEKFRLEFLDKEDRGTLLAVGSAYKDIKTSLLSDKNVMVVAHSQGNFVANWVWMRLIADQSVPLDKLTRLRIVNVGNPARISPNGFEMTLAQDNVVGPLSALWAQGLFYPRSTLGCPAVKAVNGSMVNDFCSFKPSKANLLLVNTDFTGAYGKPIPQLDLLRHNFIATYLSGELVYQGVEQISLAYAFYKTFSNAFLSIKQTVVCQAPKVLSADGVSCVDPAAQPSIQSSNANPTVLQTIQLWIEGAWSTVKTVVWKFSSGLADMVASVTGGTSQKVDASFSSPGPVTVTAVYKDTGGQQVGSGTATINVKPPAITVPGAPSIGQASKQVNGTVLVSGTAQPGASVRVTWPDNSTSVVATDAGSGAWSATSTAATYSAGQNVSAVAYNSAGTSAASSLAIVGGSPVVTASKIPHTGITANQCYGTGSDALISCSDPAAITLSGAGKQDGMYAHINSMSYALVQKSTGGYYDRTECVKDNVTGLIWEGKMPAGSGHLRSADKTYTNYGDGRANDASEYVRTINAMALCGYSDWRLPLPGELQSIVDYGVTYDYANSIANPVINKLWFPNVFGNAWFWSSAPQVVAPATNRWYVNFMTGLIGISFTNSSNAVRLVRGAIPVMNQRFIEQNNGAEIRDQLTGLIWKRCSEDQAWNGSTCVTIGNQNSYLSSITHQQAFTIAAGSNGWRLPNVKELYSLVDLSRNGPAMDPSAFPNALLGAYWTSTPVLATWDGSSQAIAVSFSDGSLSSYSRNSGSWGNDHVRLVRMP